MVTDIRDPKLVLRDLIRDSIDTDAFPVSVSSDDIHVGWYDAGKSYPQISVSNVEESPFGGGRTGYGAIHGDGSGPIQFINGTVTVNCWGGSRDDYDATGLQQKQAHEMGDEVRRIVTSHYNPDGEIDSLSVRSTSDVVDTESDPTTHRVEVIVQYTYTREQH